MTTRSYSLLRRLKMIFAISLVILLISSIASYYSIHKLTESSSMVNHTYTVLLKADQVINAAKDGETGQRGYIVTRDNSFLDPYKGAYERGSEALKELQALTNDNYTQQGNIKNLKNLFDKRFEQLQRSLDIVRKEEGDAIAAGTQLQKEMETGKGIMDQLRFAVNRIKDEENSLLEKRTAVQSRFISYTPLLIVNAALIAIIITIIAYGRIKKDLDERIALQEEEERKYAETSRRITKMETVTGKIAQGDYEVKLVDEKEDELGRISVALNDMSASLKKSFDVLKEKDFLQEGALQLADAIRGQRSPEETGGSVLKALASYLDLPIAALYAHNESSNTLELTAGYSLSNAPKHFKNGEGLVGQAFAEHDVVELKDIPEHLFTLNTALGDLHLTSIALVPLQLEQHFVGAIILGNTRNFEPTELQFLRNTKESMALGLHAALNLQKLQELFEETQAQSEELQSQHNELENINSELEAQAMKLQASEEELKVQQEELMQMNSELEGRAAQLEEKNEMILSQNLDINRKAQQLEQTTKYKSEFLANMSHELRTPLNSILLLSRLLSENNSKNLTAEEIEYAEVIQSSGAGLLTLIDEILDLSKIESGKIELDYQPVAVTEIIRDIQSLFVPLAKEKNIRFHINTSAETPAAFETDRQRLGQILKNLLSNAFKFTSEGSIDIDISCEENNISFSVRDSGIGIAADKQRSVFEAFRQADGSTRRKYGGTGLGLSISRDLALLLGGNITLTSEPGKGSNFTLTVPLSKAVADQKATQSGNQSAAAESIIQQTAEASRFVVTEIPESVPDDREALDPGEKAILIIEDDTQFAKALLNFSRKKKYKGIVAVRGDEGIDLARQYKPTAILLDIQLPVKDGWEVMQELKRDPGTRHIPVHVMSSMEARKESLEKGALDFISKPLAFDQIKQVFNRIENYINKESRKVLIVEENIKHAEALAGFLENFSVGAEIANDVNHSIDLLKRKDVDCVILDMGVPGQKGYEMLESIKRSEGMEHLPIIIFTGKSLSANEEMRIRQYADSIIVKTAHSYQRMLDEITLFLHLVDQDKKEPGKFRVQSGVQDVLQGKTVLIADDDVRNIFSLTKALEQFKINVISATDGKEALQQLKLHPKVDIILMDMMMPELDGYETTKQIRENPLYRNLPVIAVTAKTMTGDREKCIQAGASDYISKPVDIDQLISLLRVWLYQQSN